MDISSALQSWYAIHKRDLPWRKTQSPYLIWLSEIILQQTRVNQGLDYYNRFAERFPRVEDLASAPSEEVMRLWQGLGYYSRARNLHETAKAIATSGSGRFPDSYKGLLDLKGIGSYTAAAVASIAFGEPVAVVDGNVLRVVSRLMGIELPVDGKEGRDAIWKVAASLMPEDHPGDHNQAMMELGALVCLPRQPLCMDCPLVESCVAYKKGLTGVLPLKSVRRAPRDRYFSYFHLERGGNTWLRKRTSRDIWHSLFEFPLIETTQETEWDELTGTEEWTALFGKTDLTPASCIKYRHKLTHQTLHASIYRVELNGPPVLPDGFQPAAIAGLTSYALPRLLVRYLEDLAKEMP